MKNKEWFVLGLIASFGVIFVLASLMLINPAENSLAYNYPWIKIILAGVFCSIFGCISGIIFTIRHYEKDAS